MPKDHLYKYTNNSYYKVWDFPPLIGAWGWQRMWGMVLWELEHGKIRKEGG
jgi:hypothetical protein